MNSSYNRSDDLKFQACMKNWEDSKAIYFDKEPLFVNSCVNGYRNVTHLEYLQWREFRDRREFDVCVNQYAAREGLQIAQEKCEKRLINQYTPTKIELTASEKIDALERGLEKCKFFYNKAIDELGFSDAYLTAFGGFMERIRRNSPDNRTILINGRETKFFKIQKEMINYLKNSRQIYPFTIVTPKMLKEFKDDTNESNISNTLSNQ
ncbi:MAG: hypothetical protein AAF915_19310 [Cyanobacteria bacterium P01_D01_bin.50]